MKGFQAVYEVEHYVAALVPFVSFDRQMRYCARRKKIPEVLNESYFSNLL